MIIVKVLEFLNKMRIKEQLSNYITIFAWNINFLYYGHPNQ